MQGSVCICVMSRDEAERAVECVSVCLVDGSREVAGMPGKVTELPEMVSMLSRRLRPARRGDIDTVRGIRDPRAVTAATAAFVGRRRTPWASHLGA